MLTAEWSRGNSNEVLQFCPRCWSILQPFHSNSKTLEDWGNLAQSENAPARFTRIGWHQIWRNLAQQSGKAKEVQCQSYVMSWFLHRLSNRGGYPWNPVVEWGLKASSSPSKLPKNGKTISLPPPRGWTLPSSLRRTTWTAQGHF